MTLSRSRSRMGASLGKPLLRCCPSFWQPTHDAGRLWQRVVRSSPSSDATCRLQLAESHLTQRLFGQILGRIERLAWHPT